MKRFLSASSFVVALAAVAFAAAEPSPSPAAPKPAPAPPMRDNPLTQRFKQVRERIGALYEHRNEPAGAFEPRHNPFRTPGSAIVAPSSSTAPVPPGGDTKPRPTSPESSQTLLQQAVAQLKVSGVFEIAGRSHLVINARPYKEGDVVQTTIAGETVYLRVREISKRSVILAFNDAEITLNF